MILVDIACVPSPRSLSRSPCSPGSGTLCATLVRHHPSIPLAHCPSPQTARQLTYRHAGLYHKNAKLLFLGLDNAGKTTLLYLLRTSRVSQHSPTQQPTSEEVSIGSIRFRAFDLGGHASARQIWRNYYARVDGIVFLVDLADRARFPEANLELDWLMSDDMLSVVPVVILGTKMDMPSAASEGELRSALELQHVDGLRPIGVFMVSVLLKMGYADAFK